MHVEASRKGNRYFPENLTEKKLAVVEQSSIGFAFRLAKSDSRSDECPCPRASRVPKEAKFQQPQILNARPTTGRGSPSGLEVNVLSASGRL
jgi:hypothetical protein